jgi:hypothetical protein
MGPALFARVSPAQKNRILLALKSRGHVVGYLGDGINDAPSLHAAEWRRAPTRPTSRSQAPAASSGEEDFTVTTQTEIFDLLDRVLSVVTLAVAGIGAISLIVGSIETLTMIGMSVGERTSEIGLASLAVGLAGAVLPARRAARLDPLEALRTG